MTEIPADIRQTADRLSGEVWRAFHDDDEGNMSAAQVIAQALLAERMAERERCAKVAQNPPLPRQSGRTNAGGNLEDSLQSIFNASLDAASNAIAATIRSQP